MYNGLMVNEKKITIYYDGTCRFCSGIVEKLEHSSQSENFTPKDIHASGLPAGIDPKVAERDVHVVDTAGKTHTGADAVIRILAEYPSWRWFATLVGLPAIKQIATLTYRVIADNRHRL